MLFSIIMGKICLRIKISRILAKNSKRPIGRCDDSRLGCLFDLGTNIMVENFQSREKYESLRISLYMCEI